MHGKTKIVHSGGGDAYPLEICALCEVIIVKKSPAPTTSPEEERCICAKGRGMDVIHNFLCPLSNPPTPKDNKPQGEVIELKDESRNFKLRDNKPQIAPWPHGIEMAEPKLVTSTNNGWEEEFDKNLPPSGVDWREKTESEVHQFGYKVLRGNEIFTVVDWGNIKKFISTLLTAEREKAQNIAINAHETGRDIGRQEGRTQTKEAILSLIKGMEQDNINPATELPYYKEFNKGHVAGYNSALTDLSYKLDKEI